MRPVEVRAEDLARGDVVLSSGGAAWEVEAVTAYVDRDGRSQVAATGQDGRGERFALQRKAHQSVRVQRPTVVVSVEVELAR